MSRTAALPRTAWCFCLALACLTLFSVLPASLSTVSLASAWGCKGHMLVAQIAYNHLTELNREKADKLARYFHEKGPFPLSPNFVEFACWSDDLKAWHQYSMAAWHFMDIPFHADEEDNTTRLDGRRKRASVAAPLEKVAEPHVVSAARDMLTALQYAHKSPFYNLQFSLFNLVHFVGDMHQPLHTATRVTRHQPNGDRGGNMFHVLVNGRTESLHSLWDNMCEVTAEEQLAKRGAAPRLGPDSPRRSVDALRLHRPLSAADYQKYIVARAEALEDQYKFPKSLVQIKKENLKAVAEESHYYAVNTSYQDVTAKEEVVGTAYLERCQVLCEQRVVLGGLRLGYLLNEVLEDIDNIPEDSAAGVAEVEEVAVEAELEKKTQGRRQPHHKPNKKGKKHTKGKGEKWWPGSKKATKSGSHHRAAKNKNSNKHATKTSQRTTVLAVSGAVFVFLLFSTSCFFAKATDYVRFQRILLLVFIVFALLVYVSYEK